MKITVLTPTCDRPAGIVLLERMMARQTRKPDEWIVADGGQSPANLTMGQIHLHDALVSGAANFANNLRNGIAAASGDIVIFCEDDDYYAPTHVESLIALAEQGHRLLGTEPVQRYYHVGRRCYRMMNNVGASLCQTAVHRAILPGFLRVIETCAAKGSFGIDTTFWRSIPQTQWAFTRQMTVVGIKGLPGAIGLGIGHRPDARWTRDPHMAKLRSWIGDDVSWYSGPSGPFPFVGGA